MASSVLNASHQIVWRNTSAYSTIGDDVILINALISDAALEYVHSFLVAIVCAALGLFGLIINGINIVVFAKMKFKETINIALLGLAVSDSISLLFFLWTAICHNPLFRYSHSIRFLPFEIQHKTGGWTHIIFSRVTAFITAYITLERCLCIAFPMKIKSMLTPNRVWGIILSIYFLVFVTLSPNYFTIYFGWKFVPEMNRTMIGMILRGDGEMKRTVTYILNTIYVMLSFTGVVICSAILIWKLKQRSKWLNSNATSEQMGAKSSAKDQKVIKMVVYVAAIFIACYAPSVIMFVVFTLFPEMNVNRSRENVFYLFIMIVHTLNAINSTVNFFIYLGMSSKFAQTFRSMFTRPKRDS